MIFAGASIFPSKKICRERCGSKHCVVHVFHRCSGLAISQMSSSTGSQPSKPSSLAEFGNSSTSRNVRESRTPDDDAVVNQAHIEKLERAIEILVEESPQAQGLIAALKQVQERAVVPPIGWSSIGFLSGFRRACQEVPHGCQGGSYQGPPHEKYTRIRFRARVQLPSNRNRHAFLHSSCS